MNVIQSDDSTNEWALTGMPQDTASATLMKDGDLLLMTTWEWRELISW